MTFLAWWRRRNVIVQVAAVVIGFWVIIVVVLGNSDAFFGASPAPGAATSTSASGYAALVSLLEEHGNAVREVPIGTLPPVGGTLLVTNVALSANETRAVVRFVRAGGIVVAIGGDPIETVRALVGSSASWTGAGPSEAIASAKSGLANVHRLDSDGAGAYSAIGAATPLVGSSQGELAASARVGSGRVILVADPSVFSNDHIAQADNAAFAIAVLGTRGGRVEIADAGSTASGIGALPARWRWALLIALVGWAAWIWSRANRLGPIDEEDDALSAPARGTYVDSLATTLARMHDPAPVASTLQSVLKDRLAREARLASWQKPHGDEIAAGSGSAPDSQTSPEGSVTTEAELIALTRLAQRTRMRT